MLANALSSARGSRRWRANAKVARLLVRKLEGQGEARLIALGCSDPREGYSQWTLHLLADRLVDLQVVERISIETVRQTLKKNELRPHRWAYWVMPPDENADFVAAMERGLDGYERPEAPKRPVVADR